MSSDTMKYSILDDRSIRLTKVTNWIMCTCGKDDNTVVLAMVNDGVFLIKTPITVLDGRFFIFRCGKCKTMHKVNADTLEREVLV